MSTIKTGDRMRPPKGYGIREHDDLIDDEVLFLPSLLYREYKTNAEAVAACWAHHDAILNRGIAMERAAVAAYGIPFTLKLCDSREPVHAVFDFIEDIERGEHSKDHADALSRREREAAAKALSEAADAWTASASRPTRTASWLRERAAALRAGGESAAPEKAGDR